MRRRERPGGSRARQWLGRDRRMALRGVTKTSSNDAILASTKEPQLRRGHQGPLRGVRVQLGALELCCGHAGAGVRRQLSCLLWGVF